MADKQIDTSEADSEQWQQYDRRERAPLEFVQALINGGLARIEGS